MRISFLIGYGASMLPLLSKVLEEESKEHGFEYIAAESRLSELYIDKISESDLLLLYTHELPEKVEEVIKGKKIVSLSDRYFSNCSTDFCSKVARYFKTGGEKNFRNLVHLILRELGKEVEVEPVEEVPWHGIYHPKLGTFGSLEEYAEKYEIRKPVAGVLFYRNYWLYGNAKYIEDVIESLEEEGFSVIPVFTYGFRDELLNTPTKEDSIREFFMAKIDVLINLTFFFLLDRWREKRETDLLKLLNVPILTPIVSHYKSVEDWISDPQGIDYFSQVYSVTMPEMDGLIEPIFISGAKVEGTSKTYETYKPHAKYIARRAKKWVELREKDPKEKRIAIVLINPPCKGLEANVAVGMGLDVPESIVKLLWKLRDCGYEIGANLPRDGNELVKMILDRKAISEFRWTSVEEIVRKGGAIDFVDEGTYLTWFEELPEDVKAEMIKSWGHPSEVLRGKVSKQLVGMVYDGKFVIPGIRFGNVAIIPQPKFGCAGSACDGKVCKVLHEPKIPPPHQWLAVYRWITRVFKANAVIHFGTHGYLEFRPGKGVGLSPSCWPEISIDDTPHLYVYVVSNPMEGVIAKRRSYAEIVDHLYPPMAIADVLEDLDLLLNQYLKAKQNGDFTRAEIVYREIVEKAKKFNVPIKGKSPEEVVQEVHRYIDVVRSTQINLGLHVFGNPPRDPAKLANYAVAVMAFDSHALPSIVRTLIEYIGLNYNHVKSNPNELNEFGLTNSETLDLARKVAVKVLERILRNPELKVKIVDVVREELELFFGRCSYAGQV